jgi:FkbM family methyltransferase
MGLRGGLTMQLDLGDHMQRTIAADCLERPEEDVTVALLKPGDQVLDIGANIGYHALRWARHVGQDGAVFAFEPAPPNYAALLTNLALNPELPVQPQQIALGDRAGSLSLSSDRPGITSGSYSAKNSNAGGFDVPQLTLDEWAVDRDLSRLRLVKLDVEGWEAKVLDGASRTIADLRPTLMLEWNPGHDETIELATRIRQLTGDLGYTAFLIDRSRIAGKGMLVAPPKATQEWPNLCNVLLVPTKN